MSVVLNLPCVELNADVKFLLLGDFRQLPAVLDSWPGGPSARRWSTASLSATCRRAQAQAHGEHALQLRHLQLREWLRVGRRRAPRSVAGHHAGH